MTRPDLLAVVYKFYPRGLFVGTGEYNRSEERCRQREAARRGVAEYPTWKAMIRRLGARYSVMDHSVRVLGATYLEGGYDPAYSGDLDLPGHTLGFHVSLLGPYYGIHRTGAPGEEPAALILTREIEASYPGYEETPPELGNEVVPDVEDPGTTTIYVCLLSEVWGWSSGSRDQGAASHEPEEPDPGAEETSDPQFEGLIQRRVK